MKTDLLLDAIIIGVGATAVMDIWAFFLKRAMNIASLNFCMVGRWLCHMPEGRFTHTAIGKAEARDAECLVGWAAHYLIGVLFAFVWLLCIKGITQMSLVSALLFGALTVLIPYFIMQPALGMGFMASNAPAPWKARGKSLITHLVFGLGMYLSALIIRGV
ncbi:DUF2938 family protein [Bowmanella sp. Y26]|uniref:DUF2938 domain-containing protein n=1 Tax=Bowmanella yangjiangensis TaxID=2811230 RepID=UPI001BDDC4A6|nr:DUF2938 domain-containing protein [Bowmanella yangjiangensis]MBT1063604.1 DUF2938 family protein [Bowmanella yangjiangensis]